MAINTNNITPNTGAITTDTLYTVNRPVQVSYRYSSSVGTEIPKAVEITVWGNSNGDWLPLGASLYKNKDFDSTATAPTFTFDISGILKANVTKNFHKDVLDQQYDDPISMRNEGSNPNYQGMIACRVKAKCYYEVDGIIEPASDTATEIDYPSVSGKYILASDLWISDNIPSVSSIRNLPNSIIQSWLWDGNTTSSITNKGAATNCPFGLRRKIPIGYPLIMGMIFNDPNLSSGGFAVWRLNYTHSTGTASASLDGVPDIGTDTNCWIWNYKPDAIVGGTTLFANVSHTWPQMRSNFSLHLQSDTNSRTKEYLFELIGYSSTNSHITPRKPNTEMIYWINDLGFLDFYYFNGGFEIETESERINYIRGNHDFTNTDKLRFGVASGKTIVKKTCYTEAVNHDTIMWLSEILRSTDVFVYDVQGRMLRSVEVIDGMANPLGFGGGNAQFSVTYIDNTIVQKG